ncbi:MAG: bifunctional phosphoribosylaminoimidazolecarboxamide formyltransferase/inosine monophosphate cyclohydrolase [Planctomycetaceae bacterium]|nr:bifunctional phosphoribosylaminoimidazolecarboxamide formyltransferase/inosine monophosphate cyclohydrolase [Planctomycetaceae bacterium]
MSNLIRIRRALLSVSDKTDLIPFARKLAALDVTLISTGGTARVLEEAGLTVIPIDQVTGFPEMMDGRVKTLHPKVHGGLLALRDNDDHVKAMKQHDIEPIDLVCINLYPFEQTVADPDVAEPEAIEQIDIGGPSMVRSAAKNHPFVTVVTDAAQYDRVVNELDAHQGSTTLELRRELCTAAFTRTAAYDTAIATWMSRRSAEQFPAALNMRYDRSAVELRYGENPHQAGALYLDPDATEATVARSKLLHGIPMGFCNYYDANAALEAVKEIDPRQFAAATVVKHGSPCGYAIADDVPTAVDKAFEGDPLAAYGGIMAINRPVSEDVAKAIGTGKKYMHVIIAPSFEPAAVQFLAQRWDDVRIVEVGDLPAPAERDANELDVKYITGGLLVQPRDLLPMDPDNWEHKAGPAPNDDVLRQFVLAMIIVKHLKSNSTCIVGQNMLYGGGMGQVDRVAGCRLALERAGDRADGAVAATDGLFPFRDGPDLLIEAGVKAIIEPGGSKRDDDVVEACRDANVTLMFTGSRHFRH